VTTPPPDGTLLAWEEIEEAHDWAVLLLGNGLSANIWPSFGYRTLFEHASGLTPQDRAIFDGTPNFERALADVNTAIRVSEALSLDTEPLFDRYKSIQAALGDAVREVHVSRPDVPEEALATIREEMLTFEWVFTTSYDLLVYYAMGYGGSHRPFTDGFMYNGRCEFDGARFAPHADDVPVFFLHGALHLVVGASGGTWKLRRNARTLLDQFGLPIDGDPHARPLLVTEGSSNDKLRAIEGNEYLSGALDTLRSLELPTVVFGSSLSEQDDHLVEALNEHPDRPVAISMLPDDTRELAARQGDIYGRLEVEDLLFFDATTHPLGGRGLRAEL
jgi:hypothetical protein